MIHKIGSVEDMQSIIFENDNIKQIVYHYKRFSVILNLQKLLRNNSRNSLHFFIFYDTLDLLVKTKNTIVLRWFYENVTFG